MLKTLFWIIVAACVIVFFPAVAAGAVAFVALLFVAALVALLTKDRRDMKKQEEEQERAEVSSCELYTAPKNRMSTAELERSKEQSEIAQKWAKIHKEKREAEIRAAEEEHRAQAERVAKYNRLAKEAAAAGDLEDAECWRLLAVAELDKYTNKSTNRF